ncbi:MAG: MOSC domain-containing protein [Acidimicrobiia bacterium]
MATVHQINLSDGGVPKLPVDRVMVTALGVLGDRQRNTQVHGGPERALCLFSLEVIEALRAEGHSIYPGAAGENITITGLDWNQVIPGVRLAIGPEVVAKVASYTAPCQQQARWFTDGDFTRLSQSRNPGRSRVYARILEEGVVSTGDEVSLLT